MLPLFSLFVLCFLILLSSAGVWAGLRLFLSLPLPMQSQVVILLLVLWPFLSLFSLCFSSAHIAFVLTLRPLFHDPALFTHVCGMGYGSPVPFPGNPFKQLTSLIEEQHLPLQPQQGEEEGQELQQQSVALAASLSNETEKAQRSAPSSILYIQRKLREARIT